MNILVEVLTVSNFSGRHVFAGMFEQVVKLSRSDYTFIVLYNATNRDLVKDYGPRVRWVECPAYTSHWMKRAVWMRLFLARYVRDYDCQWLYTPSGFVYPWIKVKQASYVANPWALVYHSRKNISEWIKAKLQARGYAQAVRRADLMIYISDYMRALFCENAGCESRGHVLFYSGIKEDTFARAKAVDKAQVRVPGRILTVSLMTPHKNLECIARAMVRVFKEVPQAHWAVVGKWSDADYERTFRALIRDLGIEQRVDVIGYLDDAALEREYAKASVYTLMSKCESFGIPAVEAQAYGTPAVSSSCCAIPEVCGIGGVYPEADDDASVAREISALLTDVALWEKQSAAARVNAERFHWADCAQPLLARMNGCKASD